MAHRHTIDTMYTVTILSPAAFLHTTMYHVATTYVDSSVCCKRTIHIYTYYTYGYTHETTNYIMCMLLSHARVTGLPEYLLMHPIPYSGLFSNQKFLYKCLKINFGGFIFEVSIFRSIPLSLLPCPIVT